MNIRVLREMTPADFPNDQLKEIAESMGVEAAAKVWDIFKGSAINFPVRLDKNFALKYIAKNYNGQNIDQIARDLSLTTRTVSKYLDEKVIVTPSPQMSLFNQAS
jgi:hypothetical protein